MTPFSTSSGNGTARELVLITGGAGFIGSHVADDLLREGYRVRALDCLDPQVHGPERARPAYLDDRVELLRGDVRDREAVDEALEGAAAVFHFASAVGVGQSMYEVERYTSVNSVGTSVLLEALSERSNRVRKLVVASSMSVYGEGLYKTSGGELLEDVRREEAYARDGRWECERDGEPLTPLPTPETKRPSLASIYALNKYDQERQCLIMGESYGVPTTALRFFNVYGPRQALSNPYTGVIAIFASRLLNGKRPVIFEDGLQRRDFVSVYDIARACRLAMQRTEASGRVINVGSGRSVTVREIAEAVADVLDRAHLRPEISGESRSGDIRHCFADIGLARELLGYRPRWELREGLADLADWLADQTADDRTDEMRAELQRRGLATPASAREAAE